MSFNDIEDAARNSYVFDWLRVNVERVVAKQRGIDNVLDEIKVEFGDKCVEVVDVYLDLDVNLVNITFGLLS